MIRRWAWQQQPVRAEDLDELTRFGEAMDQALSESISLYSGKVDDSRNLLLGFSGRPQPDPSDRRAARALQSRPRACPHRASRCGDPLPG